MKILWSKNKPSFRGLILFIISCALPVLFFRTGYKFVFSSKEIILLLFLNFSGFFFYIKRSKTYTLYFPQIFILLAALPVFIFNFNSAHVLSVLCLYLVLFFLTPDIVSKDEMFIWLAWSAMLATVLSIYIFWSMALGVAPDLLRLAVFSKRMAGVLGQQNLLACLIVVGLFSWLQALYHQRPPSDWRWYYQIPVIIFFWALLLTGSKAGLLAFVSSLLFLGWGLARSGQLEYLKSLALKFSWSLPLGVVFFMMVQPPGLDMIDDRVIDFGGGGTSSGTRLILYGSAIAMGGDHIWSGVGVGGFRRLVGSYLVPVTEFMRIPYDSIVTALWAHNDFLHILAECGLFVFLLFLFVYVCLLFFVSPTKNLQAMFCFCALLSFFIFMQFGNTFNDHVLVFYLLFLASGAMQFLPKYLSFDVSRKYLLVMFIPCFLLINYNIVLHAYDMHLLKDYFQKATTMPLTMDNLSSLRNKLGYDNLLKDPLSGWEFRYTHLLLLGEIAVKKHDYELSSYLIPEFENFQSEHFSYPLVYQLSRLYFIIGEYSLCKVTADRAYSLKPDMHGYSNFGHICLVFDISRREKKPVIYLFGERYYSELVQNKVFCEDRLDENLVAY